MPHSTFNPRTQSVDVIPLDHCEHASFIHEHLPILVNHLRAQRSLTGLRLETKLETHGWSQNGYDTYIYIYKYTFVYYTRLRASAHPRAKSTATSCSLPRVRAAV